MYRVLRTRIDVVMHPLVPSSVISAALTLILISITTLIREFKRIMLPVEKLKLPGASFSPDQLAPFVIQARVAMLNHDAGRVEDDEPFFVADLGQVHRQHQRWTQHLPAVQPFYGLHAMQTLSLFFALLYSFDCLKNQTNGSVVDNAIKPSNVIQIPPCYGPLPN